MWMAIPGNEPKTALIVEDERVLALDFQRTLNKLGYVTASVSSGIEALRLAEQVSPELVLMDIHLEGAIDGIETAQSLRALGDFALIYVTGGLDVESRVRAEVAWPDAWLAKPFTPAQFAAAIERALAAHRLRPPGRCAP